MIFIAKSALLLLNDHWYGTSKEKKWIQKYIYLADTFIQMATQAESNSGIELISYGLRTFLKNE